MGTVAVEGIKLYAYHGCIDEEGVVGRGFEVDVYVTTDFTKAMLSDNIADTVDYVSIYNIVKREMDVRSKLLEHVGNRIIATIKSEIAGVEAVEITIRKMSPPINGVADSVSITMEG